MSLDSYKGYRARYENARKRDGQKHHRRQISSKSIIEQKKQKALVADQHRKRQKHKKTSYLISE